MSHFIQIILFSMFISNVSLAQSDSSVPQRITEGGLCYELLTMGEKVYGTYECPSCGGTTSAKRDADNRVSCKGCGQPHPGVEIAPFIDPEFINRHGRQYVLVGSEKALKDGTEGNMLLCESCGTANNKTATNCVGCGATTDPQTAQGDAGRTVSPTESNATRLRFRPTRSQARRARSSSASAPSEFTQPVFEQPGISGVQNKLIGAGALALAGTMFWGSQTYSEVGIVESVNPNQNVTVVYTHGDSEPLRLQLSIRNSSGPQWVKGEVVEVFFRNIGGAKGAERMNGDVIDQFQKVDSKR